MINGKGDKKWNTVDQIKNGRVVARANVTTLLPPMTSARPWIVKSILTTLNVPTTIPEVYSNT